MIQAITFSPSGTTNRISRLLTDALGQDVAWYDLIAENSAITLCNASDIVVLASPVYAGRIPPFAAQRFSQIKGSGQKAIAIVVYGNRDYDDALLELCDIATRQGLEVVAAGAFVAEHCIFPKVAANRPDSRDIAAVNEFAQLAARNIAESRSLDLNTIKGNRPYKKIMNVPIHPKADKNICNGCGKCVGECPAEAIDKANPLKTDQSRCITCCRCIHVCPQSARRLGGMLYKIAGWKFVRDNRRRREAEWFA